MVPFVLDGLRDDEPVFVAVPANLALLRDALGDACQKLTMADLTDVGRNPSRILGIEDAFAARHAHAPVRMVGEVIWPGRTADEYPVCVNHEALVHTAFARRAGKGLCPYDARRLEDDVLCDARTTHPLLSQTGFTAQSADYAPDEALVRYNQPLPTARWRSR